MVALVVEIVWLEPDDLDWVKVQIPNPAPPKTIKAAAAAAIFLKPPLSFSGSAKRSGNSLDKSFLNAGSFFGAGGKASVCVIGAKSSEDFTGSGAANSSFAAGSILMCF